MQQLASKYADLLEQVASKVKSMTVDRVAEGIRLAGLGVVAATMVITALVFLPWAVFGALEIPLTTAGAFAVLGALMLAVGGWLWLKRAEVDDGEADDA